MDSVRPLAGLPVLPRHTLSRENSSCSREGINRDSGNFLYTRENGEAVLFDAAGPGRINSIFATALREDSVLHFYFEGEEHPGVSMPAEEFFAGAHPCFPPPMISYDVLGYYLKEKSLAGNCFIPIPFQKSLKITATGYTRFFYHILWEQYPDGADPKGEEAPVQEGTASLFSEKTFSLPPGGTEVFYQAEGAGCIAQIDIQAPCGRKALEDIWLCIRWEDHPLDSVRAPLKAFFAVPAETVEIDTPPIRVRQLPSGQTRLTCRWPMPYFHKAALSLKNRGDMTLPDISVSVCLSERKYDERECGLFTAQYREGRTTYGREWTLFEGRGRGKYVATVQMMQGGHYCEGDEHFYLDGARYPQINGTGTEDYYLFCFWPNPVRCTPYSGSTTDANIKGGGLFENAYRFPSAYYRFHLDGPIAFYSGIDARIQHGGLNEEYSNYLSLSVAYLSCRSALKKSDFIDPSSAASRDMHGFTAEQYRLAETESTFLGKDSEARERLTGLEIGGGEACFIAALHPQNRGARLRRIIDQGRGLQKAEVYVDGAYCGVWCDADENGTHRFRDSDFMLPEGVCAGRDRIRITLKIQCGVWTDYGFEVYSLTA